MTKSKLIKLNEEHYIIVDDSEIEEGELNIPSDFTKLSDISITFKDDLTIVNDRTNGYLKITHSTQPLELKYNEEEVLYNAISLHENKFIFNKIKSLSLSEVEKVVYGYSVEKVAENSTLLIQDDREKHNCKEFYIAGFKAHQELVKDKLNKALELIQYFITRVEEGSIKSKTTYTLYKDFMIGIDFKTEWDVEFADGKLKLND